VRVAQLPGFPATPSPIRDGVITAECADAFLCRTTVSAKKLSDSVEELRLRQATRDTVPGYSQN